MNLTRPLPLFPLTTVLYPGSVVPLHIFEPRYRRMMGYCLEFDRRFGFIYHDPDVGGPFLNEIGRIGCVAQIERMELLEDGRSLILTQGCERFRIVHEVVDANTPYFQAMVEEVPDAAVDLGSLRERRRVSLTLFRSVLEKVQGLPEPLPEFDLDEELSYRLAATIDTMPTWHQQLLELVNERERLDWVDDVFRAARKKLEEE